MNRLTPLVICVLAGAPLAVSASAADPPEGLTPDARKKLEVKWRLLDGAGGEAYGAGKLTAAAKSFREALSVARDLYPKADHPDGHQNLATSLNNLATVLAEQGLPEEAATLHRDALDMRRRLFKGDHPDVANSLNNLAVLHQSRGKYADAETLHRDALDMRKRLSKGDHPDVANSLNNLAEVYQVQGKLADAESLHRDGLAMTRRLFKGDHPDVAGSMNNLAAVCIGRRKLTDAEPLLKEALAMRQRLFRGDHPDVATGMNNLAMMYQEQGKLTAAEPLLRDGLAMTRRVFEGDHPDVATGMNNLAALYQSQEKFDAAERLYTDALAMTKRLFRGDHPDVAIGMNNLADVHQSQGKWEAAEPLLADALAMTRRLFRGDHPLAVSVVNNLASVYEARGKLDAAEPLYKEALAARRRLFEGDHPAVAGSLSNLAYLYHAQGRFADAQPLLALALDMRGRLTTAFARQKSPGEALTFSSALPLTRDAYLSLARARAADPTTGYDPATSYAAVWAAKWTVARAFEQRQLQARAATDPPVAKLLGELADARRRRAELLLAPVTKDPGTRKKREADLEGLDRTLAKLDETLPALLPAVARAERLDAATAADLQKALPADAALVDFVRYADFEWDRSKPGRGGERRTFRYLAFVVTRDKVAWVDLDAEAEVRRAVDALRAAITSGKEIPAALPARVRELVWGKVRRALPAAVKTVYICPDRELCKVPFAALPGDKPGTILLEDFAVATIPHAPFLLDKLLPQDPAKNTPTAALVVGGVEYDADVAPTGPNAVAGRDGPPVEPGAKRGWGFLPKTVGEARGVAAAAVGRKFPVTQFGGDKATASAVLAALPKARYAHFATHGFFADPSFRSVFQLDENDYRQSLRGERIGRAANSPLVMTGLVLAGANNPKTPGRGIATGEQLIDLDLSGLELAVLSACETGLGDVAGGEGTFGLQRAFHYAGTRDVVASLWKVPDASTAALMALFYQNLWDKNLSPVESLRQAQLEIYKNPAKIPELAEGFRGKFEEVPGMGGEVEIKPPKDGKAHPLLWAAFTLSGPGR